MRQIGEWLEKLGMSEYAQRFTENGINIAALPHLTDQDLKEIGVLLGHRRIVLAAISELTSAAAPVTSQPAATRAEPRDDAERRRSPSCSPVSSVRPRSPTSSIRRLAFGDWRLSQMRSRDGRSVRRFRCQIHG